MKILRSFFAMILIVGTMCTDTLGISAEKKDEQKVIVIDAGHQTRGMSATEPNGPGSKVRKAKVTGGTSGCSTHLPEYKLNLQVAKKLQGCYGTHQE